MGRKGQRLASGQPPFLRGLRGVRIKHRETLLDMSACWAETAAHVIWTNPSASRPMLRTERDSSKSLVRPAGNRLLAVGAAAECAMKQVSSSSIDQGGGKRRVSPVRRRISGKRNLFGHNPAHSNSRSCRADGSRSCRADGRTLWVCDVCFC